MSTPIADQGGVQQVALGYCRVSTDGQGERGYGLEAQRSAIDVEVARRGWSLSETYVDIASGGSTKRRIQLQQALDVLAAGEATVLIVAKLDRLSRSLVDFAAIMATSREQGWSIVALDIGVDTSTINGELVANIIMALAQWERRIIGQRTKDALSQVAASGTVLGRPANVSAEARATISVLVESGASYRAIASALNKAKVPTAQGGRQWYASTVRTVALHR